MTARSSATARATRAVPSERSRSAASAGEAASRARATSTVRLPSTRSSPAGLPVVAGVAEDAEQVVAQLERLAQRQPERRQRGHRRRRRAGEGGADVQRPLDGVLRRLVAQHGHRGLDVGAAAGLHGDVEELAGDHLASGTGRRPRAPGATWSIGSPQRRSSSSAQLSSRSPSRIAAAAPYCSGSPRHPAARCSRPKAAVRGGPPAAGVGGVHQSSCTSALACSSSSEAQARTRASSSSARRARPRGSPSSRTTPGSACRRRPTYGPRATSRAASGPSGASRAACSSRNASSVVLDAAPGTPALSHPVSLTSRRETSHRAAGSLDALAPTDPVP